MIRRLFNILAGLSLVLFVATAGMWGVSIINGEFVCFGPTQQQLQSLPVNSQLRTTEFGIWLDDVRLARMVYYIGSWEILGKAVLELRLPCWGILLATSILPSIWLIRRYRSRPYPVGFCQKCCYNLTGNVSGICPECGTEIVVKP